MNKWDQSVSNPNSTRTVNIAFHGLVYFCYAICIICIVAGTALSLFAIWGSVVGPTLAKLWATIATFFCGSILTLVVTKITTKSD